MGDTLQTMLRDVIEVFRDGEKLKISEIARMDDTVDDLHMAIKLYLTDVSREPLDEKESGRCAEIMSFNTNLEHIGDIIDKNLLELASKQGEIRSAILRGRPAGHCDIAWPGGREPATRHECLRQR